MNSFLGSGRDDGRWGRRRRNKVCGYGESGDTLLSNRAGDARREILNQFEMGQVFLAVTGSRTSSGGAELTIFQGQNLRQASGAIRHA